MKKAVLLISMMSVAALAGGPAWADGETVAVFTKNQTNPFFESVRVGAANVGTAAQCTLPTPATVRAWLRASLTA